MSVCDTGKKLSLMLQSLHLVHSSERIGELNRFRSIKNGMKYLFGDNKSVQVKCKPHNVWPINYQLAQVVFGSMDCRYSAKRNVFDNAMENIAVLRCDTRCILKSLL